MLTGLAPRITFPAMTDMTDVEALDFLAEKLGNNIALAAALSVQAGAVTNWRARGISADKRPEVWMMVNDHGGNLPREWLKKRKETAPQPPEKTDEKAA